MDLNQALKIVRDLADGNTLDPRDVRGDSDLTFQLEQQAQALELVERLLVEPKLETHRMFVLSTAHITQETDERLLHEGSGQGLPTCYPKVCGGFGGEMQGWIVPIIGDVEETCENGCPDDLRAILDLAATNNCTWVMLDRDGPVVDGLPAYDW